MTNLSLLTPLLVIEMITNFDIRRKWEKRFTEIDVLEDHPNYRVLYWYETDQYTNTISTNTISTPIQSVLIQSVHQYNQY